MDYKEKTDISLRIIGENIDFEKVLINLPRASKIHRKGEVLHKYYTVEKDVIIFNYDNKETELINQLDIFLGIFENYKNNLKEISTKHDIILRIYIESEMGQLYSYIPKVFLSRIVELSMSIEYSVWSEGMCQTM